MHSALCTLLSRAWRGREGDGASGWPSHRAGRACLQLENSDQSFRARLINEHPDNSIEHQFMLQRKKGSEVGREGGGVWVRRGLEWAGKQQPVSRLMLMWQLNRKPFISHVKWSSLSPAAVPPLSSILPAVSYVMTTVAVSDDDA